MKRFETVFASRKIAETELGPQSQSHHYTWHLLKTMKHQKAALVGVPAKPQAFFAAFRAAAFLQWSFVPYSPLGGRSFRACDVNIGGQGVRGATLTYPKAQNDPGPVCGGVPDGEPGWCFIFRCNVRSVARSAYFGTP